MGVGVGGRKRGGKSERGGWCGMVRKGGKSIGKVMEMKFWEGRGYEKRVGGCGG